MSAPAALLPARTCPAASTCPGNTVTPSLGTNSAASPRITNVAVARPSLPNPNPQAPIVVVTEPAKRVLDPPPHPAIPKPAINTNIQRITCPNAPADIRIFLTVANLVKALDPNTSKPPPSDQSAT